MNVFEIQCRNQIFKLQILAQLKILSLLCFIIQKSTNLYEFEDYQLEYPINTQANYKVGHIMNLQYDVLKEV